MVSKIPSLQLELKSPHPTIEGSRISIDANVAYVMAVNVEVRERARVSVERVQDLQRAGIAQMDLADGDVAGNDEPGVNVIEQS